MAGGGDGAGSGAGGADGGCDSGPGGGRGGWRGAGPWQLGFGTVLPMLAETARAPFDDPGWLFEVKWDGYRALAFLAAGGGSPAITLLQSRRLRNLTPSYPELSRLHERLRGKSAVVDGEIVAIRNGRPDFQALQRGGGPAVFVAFDLLELDGRLLLGEPLRQRKERLAESLAGGPDLVLSGAVEGRGTSFHEAAVREGLEGVMAKRATSLYHMGRRSPDWLKLRNVHRAFALVCGYTQAADARPIGALVLGVVGVGGRPVYAGHAGTGFDQREMARLVEVLGRPAQCPLEGGEPREFRGRTTWVRPEHVVEVEYLEWTRDGRFRHPVYRGLRPDKDAGDCAAPPSAAPPSAATPAAPPSAAPPSAATPAGSEAVGPGKGGPGP